MQATMLSGLARTQHDEAEVRCRCQVCGAHAYALPNVPLSGRCGNCHSFDLRPLEAEPHDVGSTLSTGPTPRRRITGMTETTLAPPPHEQLAV